MVLNSIFPVRPDYLYSLVYDNFFQRSNVGVGIKIKIKCVKTKIHGSPEGPATGDFLRVLKYITPATNFGSILFLVQH